MNVDLSEIRRRTVSATEYIYSLDRVPRELFLARKRTYLLQPEAVEVLHKSVDDFVVVAFSASWCKDCAEQIPVLALISEVTGLEVRIFGGVKKDPLNHVSKWRIPPSPPEIVELHVDKLPAIVVFETDGNEVDRIEERPKKMPTLEQELCEIVKSRRQ
jgi:thiol-disulfide isomerase/thioredoxin